MLLAELARTSADVAATRSRLAKRAALAACIEAAGPDEIELVVGYLAGSLRQRRTGVGWASLGTPPPPADRATLTVADVDAAFEAIAAFGGSGSAAARQQAVEAVFARATAAEQPFLRGLVFGDLRQGALDSLVQDGVAAAFGADLKVVQRAAMLLGSTGTAARLLAEAGVPALQALTLQVGVPIKPMLAASAPEPAAALAKSGLPAIVDAKLDGIRAQVHKDGDRIQVFTRSLDDITDRVPEIVAAVSALRATTLVLDAEAVALRTDGKPLPFQEIASRTMSSADVGTAAARTPLSLFCFDLLHVDGTDLLDEPLTLRARRMTELLPAELIVRRTLIDSAEQAAATFAQAVADGFEGVVIKNPDAPYAAGRRDAAWVKVKPRHTLDLAVIGAEWGYGRRTGWLSNLHLAARDPDTGGLVMLGKTFKGLTDAMLTWQTEQFLARESRRTKYAVFADPPLVAEIAFDGVQRSTRYPGGVALRFARVLRYRDDKTPDEVDTIDTVRSLGIQESTGEPA